MGGGEEWVGEVDELEMVGVVEGEGVKGWVGVGYGGEEGWVVGIFESVWGGCGGGEEGMVWVIVG